MLTPCYLLRGRLLERWVRPLAPHLQSGQQFRIELSLFGLGGLGLAAVMLLYYGFPLLTSGSKLLLGLVTVGLFAAIDLALLRERELIQDAEAHGQRLHPPDRMIPLARKFSSVATGIILLVSTTMLLLFWRYIVWLSNNITTQDGSLRLAELKREVMVEVIFVMGVLLLLTMRVIVSYAKNLKLLFGTETAVLERVSNGDLGGAVPVLTDDEFGFIAGHTNAMILGLRDRRRMQQGLLVAREVQQNLLPGKPPLLTCAEIFAVGLYSDETGGDYYDFFEDTGPEGAYVGVVVGDVTGHGVGSALLMASARAMFRLCMARQQGPARSFTEVNRHLASDLSGSGRFMTAMALLVHKESGELLSCTAGHDPALRYDPESDSFTELSSTGLPLGVVESWSYEELHSPCLKTGELLLLGTDGIWETLSPTEELYGKERLRALIRAFAREHPPLPLERLSERILEALAEFRSTPQLDDDITLVLLRGRDTCGQPPLAV